MGVLHAWLYYALLPYWTITLSFFALSSYLPRSSRLQQLSSFFARALGYLAGLITCASYGIVASIVLNVVGYAGLSQWATAKSFKYVMYPLTGIWFDVDEESVKILNETRPAVILGNHQTELDILFIAHIWPKYTSVTAKSNLKYYPFLGQFMWLSNSVFIKRGNRKSAISAMDGAAKHMRESRQNVFIFPEGTRSYSQTPELLPFKKGAFHLAIQAQVPIIPVVCANYAHLLSIQKKRFTAGTVPVRALKPIPTAGLKPEDVEDLMRMTRERMLETLKELHIETLGASTNGTATSIAPELKEKVKIAMAS